MASDQPTKAERDGLGQKGSHLPGPARAGSSVLFGLGQDKLQWQVIGCSGYYLLVAVRSLLQVGLRTMTVRTLLLRYDPLDAKLSFPTKCWPWECQQTPRMYVSLVYN